LAGILEKDPSKIFSSVWTLNMEDFDGFRMFTQNKAAGNTLGHVEVHPSAVVLNCRIGSGRIGPGTQERKCPRFLLRIVRIEFVMIGCFALDS